MIERLQTGGCPHLRHISPPSALTGNVDVSIPLVRVLVSHAVPELEEMDLPSLTYGCIL